MFQLFERPEISANHEQDWNFAYQKLAGAPPCLIKRIKALPENFPVTE